MPKSNFEISGEEKRLQFKRKIEKINIKKINMINSSLWVLWKPINFLDNIPKYS